MLSHDRGFLSANVNIITERYIWIPVRACQLSMRDICMDEGWCRSGPRCHNRFLSFFWFIPGPYACLLRPQRPALRWTVVLLPRDYMLTICIYALTREPKPDEGMDAVLGLSTSTASGKVGHVI